MNVHNVINKLPRLSVTAENFNLNEMETKIVPLLGINTKVWLVK